MYLGFFENLLESEICSVVLRSRRKQHWLSSCFGSIIFAPFWHTLFLGD